MRRAGRRGRADRAGAARPAWLWAVPLLLFLSVVFLAVETPRYRTALDPFVILLAALALTPALRAIGGVARRPGG